MEFEVGKFYMVAVGWSSRKIPALCVQVAKHFVKFEYITKYDGKLEKCVTKRRLSHSLTGSGDDVVNVYDIWSSTPPTFASELGVKPSIWDDVPSPFKPPRKGKQRRTRNKLANVVASAQKVLTDMAGKA